MFFYKVKAALKDGWAVASFDDRAGWMKLRRRISEGSAAYNRKKKGTACVFVSEIENDLVVCGACRDACPAGAIETSLSFLERRKKKKVDAVSGKR